MDSERIYKKLDLIDEKLDTHMVSMEGRVTSLEEKYQGIRGHIRLIMTLIISGITGIITWISKHFFN